MNYLSRSNWSKLSRDKHTCKSTVSNRGFEWPQNFLLVLHTPVRIVLSPIYLPNLCYTIIQGFDTAPFRPYIARILPLKGTSWLYLHLTPVLQRADHKLKVRHMTIFAGMTNEIFKFVNMITCKHWARLLDEGHFRLTHEALSSCIISIWVP